MGEFLTASAEVFVRADHWAELEALAHTLTLPIGDVVLCNFYYDAMKVVLGCTAFALDTGTAVLHARNLDWWTKSAILSRYTTACRFIGAPAGEFTTIGWPGFTGAFSGIAPGRFAVTLNAVLSLERAVPAMPVSLLIRTALEEARTFDEALSVLSATPVPSDSLLLLTGIRPGEHAVIERTPSRSAIRKQPDFICVTNDYKQIQANGIDTASEILATSCGRFDRVNSLIRGHRPTTPETCFNYLSDPAVKMQITVQQMVFEAVTGKYWVRLPRE